MAPTTTPRVSVRWKTRKKIIVGVMPISDAAAIVVGSDMFCPCKRPIATETVWLPFEIRRTSGIRNSFQVQMKKNVAITSSVGRSTGTMTDHSTCQRLAPSICAASRISRGKLPSTDDSK